MAYPEECRAVGLACEPCVESSARHLASACPGLRGKSVGQLFVQIYTQSACARMHTLFVRAYAQADLLNVRGIPSKPIAAAGCGSVRAIAATA